MENTKNFFNQLIMFGFVFVLFYFWTISLLVITIGILFIIILFFIMYRVMKYISKFQTLNEAKRKKPWWFPGSKNLYIKIVETLERKAKEKAMEIPKSDIELAMNFYDFYTIEEVTKYEIKHRWKNIQKIYHPDSGSNPDKEKSQLANKYKEILLTVVKYRND